MRRLKLGSWRIEGIALVLYGSDGEALALEPDGQGGFADRDSGLWLVRPRK